MIDDIVQMILKEARKREGRDLVGKINYVMLILQKRVAVAVDRLKKDQEKPPPLIIWKDTSFSHDWRKDP